MLPGNMTDKLIPVVKADEAEEEDLVDPQATLRVSLNLEKNSKSIKRTAHQCRPVRSIILIRYIILLMWRPRSSRRSVSYLLTRRSKWHTWPVLGWRDFNFVLLFYSMLFVLEDEQSIENKKMKVSFYDSILLIDCRTLYYLFAHT